VAVLIQFASGTGVRPMMGECRSGQEALFLRVFTRTTRAGEAPAAIDRPVLSNSTG